MADKAVQGLKVNNKRKKKILINNINLNERSPTSGPCDIRL